MDNTLPISELETETSHVYRSGSRIYTKVAGVTFDGRQAILARLCPGEQIQLRRESANPYDSNAIRVERLDGRQIGYLNRHLAATLAPFFDACNRLVIAWVHCLTGNPHSGYALGVVITFNVP